MFSLEGRRPGGWAGCAPAPAPGEAVLIREHNHRAPLPTGSPAPANGVPPPRPRSPISSFVRLLMPTETHYTEVPAMVTRETLRGRGGTTPGGRRHLNPFLTPAKSMSFFHFPDEKSEAPSVSVSHP